jgi:hypothetical protein
MSLVAQIHQCFKTVLVGLVSLSAGIMTERTGQVRFAAARCASQQQVLFKSQPVSLTERTDEGLIRAPAPVLLTWR